MIELPEYKIPNLRTVAIYVWEKVKDYLTKAGTTIFLASIILWFVMNVGPTGFITNVADSLLQNSDRSWSGIKTGRTRKLADRGSADFRNFR